MRRSFRVLCTFLLFAGLVACEGPTGPEGPQGDPGPQGVQGETGTANVQYSDWTPFDEANWSDAFIKALQTRREYVITETAVDSEIMATGMVAVYVRVNNTDDRVYPLPWIAGITKGVAEVLNFELEPGSVAITFFDLVDDSADPGTFGSNVEYRFVDVSGGAPSPPLLSTCRITSPWWTTSG